jgi:hypothetical protein
LLVALFVASIGCGPAYLKKESHYAEEVGFTIDDEAQIPDTVENRQVLDVLVQYRSAIVRKDVGSLKRLVSAEYYENGGTTNTTTDDYGAEQLPKIYEMMAQHAENIRYEVTVKELVVDGQRAYVDYEYQYAYQFKVGEQPSWDAGIDVNRLELLDQDGEWKIISGL